MCDGGVACCCFPCSEQVHARVRASRVVDANVNVNEVRAQEMKDGVGGIHHLLLLHELSKHLHARLGVVLDGSHRVLQLPQHVVSLDQRLHLVAPVVDVHHDAGVVHRDQMAAVAQGFPNGLGRLDLAGLRRGIVQAEEDGELPVSLAGQRCDEVLLECARVTVVAGQEHGLDHRVRGESFDHVRPELIADELPLVLDVQADECLGLGDGSA
mmetsp:Transcript_5748/g.15568  ORF Transcript_5748/g.15568 Transcript_5748/m.15568 type:complete len:212 (+) Transcript_5748:385-1020(+)